jgi:hypothetical protein
MGTGPYWANDYWIGMMHDTSTASWKPPAEWGDPLGHNTGDSFIKWDAGGNVVTVTPANGGGGRFQTNDRVWFAKNAKLPRPSAAARSIGSSTR